MDLFQAVKEAVSARQAAEHYGLTVSRSGMALCPFHGDKNPSLKVDRRFHCFGCQADGDVIDFAARLFHLRPVEAARKLAADFSVPCDGHAPPSGGRGRAKLTGRLDQRQEEQRCFRVLCTYLHLLEQWKERYAARGPEETTHPRYVEALQRQPYIEYLLDTFLAANRGERAALAVSYRKEVEEIAKHMADLGVPC